MLLPSKPSSPLAAFCICSLAVFVEVGVRVVCATKMVVSPPVPVVKFEFETIKDGIDWVPSGVFPDTNGVPSGDMLRSLGVGFVSRAMLVGPEATGRLEDDEIGDPNVNVEARIFGMSLELIVDEAVDTLEVSMRRPSTISPPPEAVSATTIDHSRRMRKKDKRFMNSSMVIEPTPKN